MPIHVFVLMDKPGVIIKHVCLSAEVKCNQQPEGYNQQLMIGVDDQYCLGIFKV